MAHSASHSHETYFVPAPSVWPFALTLGLCLLVSGLALSFNALGDGTNEGFNFYNILYYLGAAVVIGITFFWMRDVIHESETGQYNLQVDRTYRWGMSWFIFSEVMFFGAFFGALYYARNLSLPWLSGEGAESATNAWLWSGFEAAWPSNGPGEIGGEFKTLSPWHLPLINTILLLTSGVTLTIAHHAIQKGNRMLTIIGLWATIALGVIFLCCQAMEYMEAYSEHYNLTLGSGIYGSTFFMLTGFHGMHVTLGTIMLIVIALRCMKGHFTPERHFGFEGVAWYWHFVDVVWLGLFIFVYVL